MGSKEGFGVNGWVLVGHLMVLEMEWTDDHFGRKMKFSFVLFYTFPFIFRSLLLFGLAGFLLFSFVGCGVFIYFLSSSGLFSFGVIFSLSSFVFSVEFYLVTI